MDPSFAIGSELNETGSNAHLGAGKEFVVEADESDGTFLALNTTAAIVTNVEPDHLNYWGTYDKLEAAFVDFAVATRRNDGFVVVCIDDDGGRKLAAAAKLAGADVRTYGQAADADFRVVLHEVIGVGWKFSIESQGALWATLTLKVPGVHNVLNATAAAIAAVGLGAPIDKVEAGLAVFSGTRRRFDFKGSADGIRVFDDYAHHPTEIAATLTAARDVAGAGRVVVAFQAHHYYRTALFSQEFGQALALADDVIVLEVFAPGEEFIPGSSGQTLADNVTLAREHVVFEPSWSAVPAHLVERAKPGDIIMTLGAGEIGMLCSDILEKLSAREADRER
jgi:UDP-N-acetylmuramate--alanine ligase